MADYRDHYTEDRLYESNQKKLDELARDGYTTDNNPGTVQYGTVNTRALVCLGCGARIAKREIHSTVCEPRKRFVTAHTSLLAIGMNNVSVAQHAAGLSGSGGVTPETLAKAIATLAR